MKSGVKKVRLDHRDFSYHRTFGNVAPTFTPCNFDAGFPVDNQELADPIFGIPALFFGCTGYTQTGLAQDTDKKQYNARFPYDNTLEMEGIFVGNPKWEQVGCDVRDSLNSGTVYGMQALGEDVSLATTHRRDPYFNIEQMPGLDWFDSLRTVFQNSQRSISLATPWFSSFENAPGGIVQAPPSYADLSEVTWHNHRAPGWTIINGGPYMIDYSHQGSAIGDNGKLYFSREIINQLLDISGSAAFTQVAFSGKTLYTVELTIMQTVISYCRMILGLS